MNNADKPINPLKRANNAFYEEQDEPFINRVKPLIGLTKIEHLSGLALQGILANPNGVMNKNGQWLRSPEQFAEMSILCAEELLKQLEEK